MAEILYNWYIQSYIQCNLFMHIIIYNMGIYNASAGNATQGVLINLKTNEKRHIYIYGCIYTELRFLKFDSSNLALPWAGVTSHACSGGS